MFEILLTCKEEKLQFYVEQFYDKLKDKQEAEELISTIWKRVPELSDEQEKELHKLGRKIRKKFHMKPVVL